MNEVVAVSKLSYPFWVTTENDSMISPSETPRDASKHVYAFSTTFRLMAFLECREASHWRIRLINDRSALVLLAADMHSDGAASLYVDPLPDGMQGYSAPLSDVFEQAHVVSAQR